MKHFKPVFSVMLGTDGANILGTQCTGKVSLHSDGFIQQGGDILLLVTMCRAEHHHSILWQKTQHESALSLVQHQHIVRSHPRILTTLSIYYNTMSTTIFLSNDVKNLFKETEHFLLLFYVKGMAQGTGIKNCFGVYINMRLLF